MPIDIPKFPLEEFSLATDRGWMFWDFVKLTDDHSPKYGSSQIKNHVLEKYPKLVEWIQLFPFSQISNIKFNVQKDIVVPHIDFHTPVDGGKLFDNNKNNEPCGYRAIISGDRKNKLYVMSGNKKIYAEMPNDTDVYVLGQTNCKHGVEFEPGRKTMYFHCFIDPKSHVELINRSWEKYHDYAIIE